MLVLKDHYVCTQNLYTKQYVKDLKAHHNTQRLTFERVGHSLTFCFRPFQNLQTYF